MSTFIIAPSGVEDYADDDDDAPVEYSESVTSPEELIHRHEGDRQSAMRQATEDIPNKAERRRTRRQRILGRRGAFRWLPIKFHNDLVHGSWWFVIGSVVATLIPIVPLVDLYYGFWDTTGGSLPILEDAAAFGLLIASGVFFTLGSYAFLRATEEPPLPPMLSRFSVHMATDELLAAWLFLFATIPFVPFMVVYVYYNTDVLLYWGCLISAIIFVIATYFFVLACYPSDREERRNQIVPMIVGCCCKSECWVKKHLSNDWLAGTWFFFWATAIVTAGSVFMLIYVIKEGGKNHLEIFDWATSTIDAIIFLIGSAYFCAGSYPQGELHHIHAHGSHGLKKDDFRDKGLLRPTSNFHAGLEKGAGGREGGGGESGGREGGGGESSLASSSTSTSSTGSNMSYATQNTGRLSHGSWQRDRERGRDGDDEEDAERVGLLRKDRLL